MALTAAGRVREWFVEGRTGLALKRIASPPRRYGRPNAQHFLVEFGKHFLKIGSRQ